VAVTTPEVEVRVVMVPVEEPKLVVVVRVMARDTPRRHCGRTGNWFSMEKTSTDDVGQIEINLYFFSLVIFSIVCGNQIPVGVSVAASAAVMSGTPTRKRARFG
jgi:hypothetical protein